MPLDAPTTASLTSLKKQHSDDIDEIQPVVGRPSRQSNFSGLLCMIFNHCSDNKTGLMVKSQVCSRKVSVQESMHARGVHDKQSK